MNMLTDYQFRVMQDAVTDAQNDRDFPPFQRKYQLEIHQKLYDKFRENIEKFIDEWHKGLE